MKFLRWAAVVVLSLMSLLNVGVILGGDDAPGVAATIGAVALDLGAVQSLYIALGEREQAFTWLERAYAEHDLQLQYLGLYPGFDPIRSDPRFIDLMRRVGLPQ